MKQDNNNQEKLFILPNHEWPHNNKLLRARKELLSKVTKLQRHVYQCISCEETIEQFEYDGQIIPCKLCGEQMLIRYTVIGKRLFSGLTGKELPINPRKFSIGNTLKEYRKREKMSQGDVALIFGVTQQFISSVESGEKPIPKNIIDWINEN